MLMQLFPAVVLLVEIATGLDVRDLYRSPTLVLHFHGLRTARHADCRGIPG